MADILRFEIAGHPVPWSVAKIYRRGQRKSEKLVRWQQFVRMQVFAQLPADFDDLWDDAILVRSLIFRIQKPKYAKVKWPERKPDLDNLEKGLWDALQGTVFTNDSRIVYKMSVQKIWATAEHPPGVSLQIERKPFAAGTR